MRIVQSAMDACQDTGANKIYTTYMLISSKNEIKSNFRTIG